MKENIYKLTSKKELNFFQVKNNINMLHIMQAKQKMNVQINNDNIYTVSNSSYNSMTKGKIKKLLS